MLKKGRNTKKTKGKSPKETIRVLMGEKKLTQGNGT